LNECKPLPPGEFSLEAAGPASMEDGIQRETYRLTHGSISKSEGLAPPPLHPNYVTPAVQPRAAGGFEAWHRRDSANDGELDSLDPLTTLSPGKAVQVDPMKPPLKAPGTKRLKLRCDKLLSDFAFKFNLRRYTQGLWTP